MEKKETRDMIPKFKKGNLYLYNPKNYLKKHYVNVPVLTLCINKNYSTWLCLFPDGKRGGLFPEDLKDVTIKRNE